MWQAECARVWVLCGPYDLEGRHHVEGHVEWDLAEADVDVEEGGGVALEPARLDGEGAALDGPFGAVRGHGHAAAWKRRRGSACAGRRMKGELGGRLIRTWVFPLHAVWMNETGAILGFTDSEGVGFLYCAVRVKVIPSPSWVRDDYV